ncbi:MAG: aminotransferase class I/II-fold pyridoxal phosphate-dependent enzyme [Bifidobacteriaceae bacterium]|nr:aminotransferase class I/II-fold pyridoxal phosphate-dependent enzyme [Bifidobacteriaceae bacterium]
MSPDPALGWGFTTQQIHAGGGPEPATGAVALPIYQTTAYQFPSTAAAAGRYAGTELGYTYARLNNPTQAAIEQRLTVLEGAAHATLVGSGQAAVAFTLLTLASAGDHIVASPALYGGTMALLRTNLARRGVEVTVVDRLNDASAWLAAVRPGTKAFFTESVANPGGDVADLEALAGAAHQAGVPLVVDNTVATPYVLRPLDWGADIVVYSASKYLSGHGTVIAGAVLDGGRFDFSVEPARWPDFNSEVPGYPGMVLTRDFGADGRLNRGGPNMVFGVKLRLEQLHDLGASISPFNAFLLGQGLETLSLRMDRHLANARRVAEYLAARPDVASVTYAGLPSSPYHALARKYVPRGPGGIVGFDLPGGAPAAQLFVESLVLFRHVANIGDVRSLVIHPASTTHAVMTPEEQLAAGVRPGFVRLSVGIEDGVDLLNDLDQAFRAVQAAGLGEPARVAAAVGAAAPVGAAA